MEGFSWFMKALVAWRGELFFDRRKDRCVVWAKCTVLVIQHHCGQTFGTQPRQRRTSRERVFFFPKKKIPSILWKIVIFKLTKICFFHARIHLHRDLNSLSLSADSINLLGPTPWSWRRPAPYLRLPPRASASSAGEITSLSVKPAARNSDELMSIATGGCEVSASCVRFHSSKVKLASSSTQLSHCSTTRACWPLYNRVPLYSSQVWRAKLNFFSQLVPSPASPNFKIQ